ncbi:hypothetical protein BHM03_00027967 [Ensete ventricosum]|nr:hypothetical protein BHM03_00027967 [Ensete ventricosum]
MISCASISTSFTDCSLKLKELEWLVKVAEAERHGDAYTHINAFELIGMSSCLDLSGFFEEEVSLQLTAILELTMFLTLSDNLRMPLRERSDSPQILWAKLSDNLGVYNSQEALTKQPLLTELTGLGGSPVVAA